MALPAQSPRVGRRVRTIALVGIDGSGKTTQAHRLAAELAAAGLPAVYRRNAGGRHWFGRAAARFGKEDGEQLLGRRGMLCVESVLRWLAIARTLLRRMLRREIAVMDRYAVCQYASLRARGARPAAERRARLAYRLFPRPDVTILLAVDPAIAYERIERRGYDHESMDYLWAATKAYESLPEHGDFVVVDANGTPDEVNAAIRAVLDGFASFSGDRLVIGEMGPGLPPPANPAGVEKPDPISPAAIAVLVPRQLGAEFAGPAQACP